jgi:hypothetical protein
MCRRIAPIWRLEIYGHTGWQRLTVYHKPQSLFVPLAALVGTGAAVVATSVVLRFVGVASLMYPPGGLSQPSASRSWKRCEGSDVGLTSHTPDILGSYRNSGTNY